MTFPDAIIFLLLMLLLMLVFLEGFNAFIVLLMNRNSTAKKIVISLLRRLAISKNFKKDLIQLEEEDEL